jgi:hypothetical protein
MASILNGNECGLRFELTYKKITEKSKTIGDAVSKSCL